MSKQYATRPSELLGISDDYTAYCFDEACLLINLKLENKEKPHFPKRIENTPRHYSCVSKFYEDILKRG